MSLTALFQQLLVRPRRPAPRAGPSAPALAGAAPPAAATAPPPRSVPIAVRSLTALLDRRPEARKVFKHLAFVESACYSRPDNPLGSLPPRVLEVALRQLDQMSPRDQALATLRLQLERRLQEHRARVQAALAADERKWRADGPRTRTPDFTESLLFDADLPTSFEATMPLPA